VSAQPTFPKRRAVVERGYLISPTDQAFCGWCQTNASSSPFAQTRSASGHTELTQPGESGGAVRLENVPAGEGALRIEQVVDRGLDGDEFR